MKVTRGSAKMKETKEETQNNVEMKGNEHNKCVGICFSFLLSTSSSEKIG